MILPGIQAIVFVTGVRVMFGLEHEFNGSMSILPDADPPGCPSQHRCRREHHEHQDSDGAAGSVQC